MVQAIAFAAKDFLICYECGGRLATDRNDVLTDQNPASICPLAFVSDMLSFQLSSVHATHTGNPKVPPPHGTGQLVSSGKGTGKVCDASDRNK